MGLTRPRAQQIYDIDYKQATRVVTTTNIGLASTAPNQVDGVNLSLDDRVLVTGQATASQNGIYYVVTLGSGSNGTWARSTDSNQTGELLAGTIIMVTEGIVYADTQWKLITDNPIVIGTTPLTFTQNYSANSISGGTSNVVVNSNANVTISAAGTANVLTVSNTGVYVSGLISATGNVTGNYLLANIYYATGFSASRIFNGTSEANIGTANGNANISISGTSNVAVFANTGAYISGAISATGNVTGNYLLANIYYATGFSASRIFNGTSEANIGTSGGNANISISGTSNVAVFANTGVYVSGLISATGNILTSGLISSTGNVIGSNILTTGNISANSNIVGGNILTSGLISSTGNLTSNNITAIGNVSGTYFVGNGSNLTGINTFSIIAVPGQSNVVANTIASTLTLTAGTGISIVTDAANSNISISTASNSSIFATGGDMGLVTQAVTASEDLGSVTDSVTISYDLGSVVDASGLIYPSQLVLPTFTVGTLPPANPAAQFVYLSSSAVGPMTAFSDGTNWRFTSSGNIVS